MTMTRKEHKEAIQTTLAEILEVKKQIEETPQLHGAIGLPQPRKEMQI